MSPQVSHDWAEKMRKNTSHSDLCWTKPNSMHCDRDKPRLMFYYLLAEKFGKFSTFH